MNSQFHVLPVATEVEGGAARKRHPDGSEKRFFGHSFRGAVPVPHQRGAEAGTGVTGEFIQALKLQIFRRPKLIRPCRVEITGTCDTGVKSVGSPRSFDGYRL
jgi:hypothetical protein